MSSKLDKPAAQGETPIGIKGAPEVIYLQTGGCDSEITFDELNIEWVTWSADPVEDDDTKYIRADVAERGLAQMAKRVSELEAKIEELSITHNDLRVGYAEKLHPEVGALIEAVAAKWEGRVLDALPFGEMYEAAKQSALLAAEKAREEQREEDAKMGDELEDYLWHYGHPAAVNAIQDLTGRIRRGKK